MGQRRIQDLHGDPSCQWVHLYCPYRGACMTYLTQRAVFLLLLACLSAVANVHEPECSRYVLSRELSDPDSMETSASKSSEPTAATTSRRATSKSARLLSKRRLFVYPKGTTSKCARGRELS